MTRNRLLLALLLAAVATSAAAADSSRYLISMKHGAAPRRVLSLRQARTFATLDLVAADLTPDEVAALRQSPDVVYVSPVVKRSISGGAPAMPPIAREQSPLEAEQTVPWGIDRVHARDVWPYARGNGVNVAILDTGIDSTHPDVAANVAKMYDTFDQTDTAPDDNGHGTHVAGTIAAVDNGIGVVGVAPEARLWPVKVLDASGNGTDETVVAGLDKVIAWKHTYGGNWIVSLSLGAPDSSQPEAAAFQRVADEGILAIAAAGNRGMPQLDYPGAYPTVYAIGAVDANGTVANFSSWGTNLAVVAPGVRVLSSVPRGTTTMAAASVDGADWYGGLLFTGSPLGEIRGKLVNCGYGGPNDFPEDVKGNIALMERGNDIFFADKVRNAVAAGAVGAIVYNNDSADPKTWTLIRQDCTDPQACVPWSEDVNFPWPVSIGLRQADGLALVSQLGKTVTVGAWKDDYEFLNGTSMATPHVSGIAALLWQLVPNATPFQIKYAISTSAHRLGDPGFAVVYGNGLVDALAAAKLFAPQLGGSPGPPPKHRSAPH